jgi:hypothetical protein
MVEARERRWAWIACAFAVAGAVALFVSPLASAMRSTPGPTHINDTRGRFVPIPDQVPHADGAYIDRRLKRQLVWLAHHFNIYVTEGFAGRLPSGKKVGCPSCHVSHSEHKIGLATDIVPLHNDWSGRCNKRWHSVTKLAKWAEPHQDQPLPPFRWVGYNKDEGHGCGDHLHLSWNHDEKYRKFKPSQWVELFRTRPWSQQSAALDRAILEPSTPPSGTQRQFEPEPSR